MRPTSMSRTALGTASGRAIESYRPARSRLFEDRFALPFLPPLLRAIVYILRIPVLGPKLLALRERQVPGVMGNLWCRTRFIDDAFRAAVREGFEQVVILGAGLDSRAYRLLEPSRVRVFEVDHPATQAWKRRRVARLPPERRSHVTFVAVDFDRQDLADAMAAAGFRADARTFVIWEGVTQYLDEEAVTSTLRFVSGTVPAGSRVVFTYIDRGILDGSVEKDGTAKLLAEVERQGEPWRFGIRPAELREFLAARGFELIEDVGAPEYRARYLEPLGREMNLFTGERVAVAEVTAA